MRKLTVKKCQSVIEGFKWMASEGPGMSIRDEYDLQAYQIALPVLERQESDGDIFIVIRNPGKVPDIKRPVGDVADYLLQLYQHNPEAVCDVVTYRFAGVSGQWVQDGRELLSMLEVTQPSTTPQIENDGWIEWGGGKQPIPSSTPVEVKFRSGATNREDSAGGWSWECTPDDPRYYDIIAYRVIENEGRECNG